MADEQITQLTAWTTLHTDDLLVGVDVHDASMAASGTDKNMTVSFLLAALLGDVLYSGLTGTIQAGAVTSGKLASGAALANIGAGNLTSTYLHAGAAATNIGSLGGDLSGTLPDPTVASVGGQTVTLGGALTTSGAYTLTITCTANTSVTLPTSGTLVNTAVATLSSLASIGTITTGTWHGTTIVPTYGGTGLATLTAHGVMLGEGTSNVGFATIGTAGRLLIDQGSGSDPAFEAMSGDATLASTGAITVTKTSGTAFATSATTDTTSASNISSGSLALGRIAAIANNTILANISGGSAVPAADTLTAIIDSAIGSTQGDILYRDSAVWKVLAPSTAGYVLSTGGAAANPSWIAAGGTGTVTTVSVVSANGVSGSVANATTTPAITLTLGAITPTTIVATSTIAGSNLSLGGTLTTGGALTLSGAYSTTLTVTAGTSLTLPTSGTLLSTAAAVTVAQGGTGAASFVANAIVAGGTTTTGALQSSADFLLDATNNCPQFVAQADPTFAAGDLFWSSTTGGLAFARGTALVNRLGGPIFSCGAGNAVANTVTETSIFAGTSALFGSRTIPANQLVAGSMIGLILTGVATSTGSSPTITCNVYLGATKVLTGITPAQSVTGPVPACVVTFNILMLSAGSSGSAIGAYQINLGNPAGAAGMNAMIGTNPTIGTPTTVDTTSSLAFDIKLIWSAASSSNSWKLTGCTLFLY